jgi:hypothetical protein
MGPAVDLARGWPSFFWRLTPGDVRTEWPFALHVFTWGVVVLLVIAIASRVARRRPTSSASVAAWGTAMLVAVLVQAGWWLTGSNGLGPVDAGVRVLDAAAQGRALVRIAPFGLARTANLAGTLRMRLARTEDEDVPSWRPVEGLPAGRYAVTIAGAGVAGGTLTATIGRSRTAFRRLAVGGASGHVAMLDLPVGAAALTIALDPASARVAHAIDIAPLTVDQGARPSAVASLSSRGVDVFFFDQQVFVEDDGFWVRGGQATDIAVAADAPGRVILAFANGAAANDVTVNDERLHLAPGETRDVVLTLPPSGRVPVHIHSAAGFRPSDVSSSQDRRYLGVRVSAKTED